VYDLGQTFVTRWHNKVTKSYGAFHTGVEVYGQEWSFGMTFEDWSTGVTWNAPKENPDHTFRETLCMGYTTYSEKQVLQIIHELKMIWKGCTYNVLSRNCHNFSDELCQRLGVAGLPTWVNDLAYTGAEAVEFLDSADSGYDGGAALYDFFSSVKSSVYNTFAGDPVQDAFIDKEGEARQHQRRHHRGHRSPLAIEEEEDDQTWCKPGPRRGDRDCSGKGARDCGGRSARDCGGGASSHGGGSRRHSIRSGETSSRSPRLESPFGLGGR